MKKTLLFAATALMLGAAVTSCKKGENDPFLSLKSRKARVTGEWTISSENTEARNTNSNGDVTTVKTVIDGENVTTTTTAQGNTGTVNGKIITSKWTFEKDGTFKSESEIEITTTLLGTTQTQNTKETTEGSWNFLGAVDEFKNKERIVLNTLSSKRTTTTTNTTGTVVNNTNSTYSEGDNSSVLAIDQLKNKEMIVKLDQKNTSNNTDSGGGSSSWSSSTTGERTFTQD